MTQKDRREKEAREYAKGLLRIDSCHFTRSDIEFAHYSGAQSEARRVVEWCENRLKTRSLETAQNLLAAIKREFGGEE